MTAATSTSKKSFFGVHFRNKIIENKKLLIVNSILELIGLPLLVTVTLYMWYLSQNEKYDTLSQFNPDGLIVVSIISIALSILSGIVIALFSFRYLYTKSLADMNYSLPLTSGQRFFADYLSGITVYIAPVICAVILSFIIIGVGSSFVDLSDFWQVFPTIFTAGIAVIIGMIMLYTLSVFAISCCGSCFEAVFSIIASNIIIPATVICSYFAVIESSNFGLSEESILYSNILNATSPAGTAVFIVSYLERYFLLTDNIEGSFPAEMYFRWLIPVLIVTAAFAAGAFLLCKRRKAESVSQPYVYKAFYYVILTLCVFCILASFIVYQIGIAAGLIICGILYFLLEVISKRGFRRFWASVLRYSATVAAVFIFCRVCSSTDGFGASRYVPRSSAVKSVSFEIYGPGNFSIDDSLSFTDRDIIEKTTSFNKEVVNRFFNPQDYDYKIAEEYEDSYETDTLLLDTNNNIEITYRLNNGSTVIRSYNFSSEWFDELFTAIFLSDEYAEYRSNELENNYYFGDDDNNRQYDVFLYDKLSRIVNRRTLSDDDFKMLISAYKQDLLDMTEEELKNAPVYGYINMDFEIRTTFKNTIDFLSESGFNEPDITAESLENENDIQFMVYRNFEADWIDFYSLYNAEPYDQSLDYYIQDKFISYLSFGSFYSSEYDMELEYNDDFMELLNRGTPVIIGENAAGAVCIYSDYCNFTLYLPDTEENKELLDKVYREQFEGKVRYTEDEDYTEDEYYYDGEYYID